MATLEELEKEAQTADVKLAQETEAGAAVDRQTLAASLTSCRTRIVTLNTQALASKGRLEGYMAERKKRVVEIKRYQALLVDLEAWLGEAQSTISSEIKLTSAKVVRDQIRASQVKIPFFPSYLGCFKRPPLTPNVPTKNLMIQTDFQKSNSCIFIQAAVLNTSFVDPGG